MRITWSRRKTICTLCREDIVAKIQRLDDTVRNNNKIRRLHYHPECYMSYIKSWVEKHPYSPLTSNGGRPSLGLTDKEVKVRKQLLSNLNSLRRYYFPAGSEARINLQGNIETLTARDLRRFKNYTRRYAAITTALEEVGGLPESHGGTPETVRRRLP
jgi:hypothetical protein